MSPLMAALTGLDAPVRPHAANLLGWQVTLAQGRDGSARVSREGHGFRVVVQDGHGNHPRRPHGIPGHGLPCATTAWCRADGGVRLSALAAPPALLVRAEGARTVPATPGTLEELTLAPGERLVILSASAFEALPEALVELLRSPTARVLERDPTDLLVELFTQVPVGSGVVLCRRPRPLSESETPPEA